MYIAGYGNRDIFIDVENEKAHRTGIYNNAKQDSDMTYSSDLIYDVSASGFTLKSQAGNAAKNIVVVYY